MKILEHNGGLLSNQEVAQVLQDRGAHPSAGINARATASERTAYAELLRQAQGQTRSREQLTALLEELGPFKLSRTELMQVINLAPSSPVEVHLIVEDCEGRLPEEGQVEALLAVVAKHLLPPQPGAAGGGGGA